MQAANPLLIRVSPQYIEADIKVMIVGQETDSWHGQLNKGESTVEELLDKYYCYRYIPEESNKQKRPFWNRSNFTFFEEQLVSYFKPQNKTVSCVWNNVSKIGNDGRGEPDPEITAMERTHFNVLKAEFEILKPDIIIFTTGSSRDLYLQYHFGKDLRLISKLSLDNGDLEVETKNLLAEVVIPGFESIAAIRIEHPNRRSLKNKVSLEVLKRVYESKNAVPT